MKILKTLGLGVAVAAMAAASGTASAQSQSSARKAQTKSMQEIPVCQKRLGTVSIVEPDTNWWQQLGLGSPEAIIKLFVMKSGCFGLVDRGKGLASRNIERALADSGELQKNSNIGRAQVKAADYFIVPDLVSKNENSGGGGIGAIAGGLLGSRTLGVLAGGLSTKSKEANVMLTLVNSRTTEQERMTEGYFRKKDLAWAAGGGGGWWGGFGGVGGGSYANTEIGQVITLAYLDAYKQLVTQLGGLPEDPSAAAPVAQ
ncbi:CsgG/HfaB family protein [Sphingosinicella microcystinivorans]|uniref:CsgG/HfaB family protein n=1 Tax=Sphingosinicella microcystinivorans TaxID=335406 RepID=UPI001C6C7CFD|nr:penicillin-binding protein activator LpoB [Sphingomonadaceae bacterium]